jgi:hypothetical protein
MIKNIFISVLLTVLLITLPSAQAQQPAKVPRVGWLSINSAESALPARYNAFRQGLRDLGYIEGQNIVIEHRDAEGKLQRLPDAAAELVPPEGGCDSDHGHDRSSCRQAGHEHHPHHHDDWPRSGCERSHRQSCSARREHHGADKHCFGLSRETT